MTHERQRNRKDMIHRRDRKEEGQERDVRQKSEQGARIETRKTKVAVLSRPEWCVWRRNMVILYAYCLSLNHCNKNKTKWPRQVRELILDSDSEISDFLFFDEKNKWRIYAYFAYSAYSS